MGLEYRHVAGPEVTLGQHRVVPVAHHLRWSVSALGFGVGYSYVGPRHVVVDGRRIAVIDWGLVARVVMAGIVVMRIVTRNRGGTRG